jgi:hypothetical protein
VIVRATRPALLLALALGCTGAREGAAGGILRPAAFTLTVRGLEVSLDTSGDVRAAGCVATLDFATASLRTERGATAHLVGDAWARDVVYGEAILPVHVDEGRVTSGERALFYVDDGQLNDGAGGTTPAPELTASGLDPDETTTALALLALVPVCWEGDDDVSEPGPSATSW